ncbi:hypothetical protein niasHT_032965 [Heterodera trifolii]|uniref:Uncharacterized protein n=1 Tax=Heterodera trifolii TaxID=157864 RepID=A0ABD2HTY6_9BILA
MCGAELAFQFLMRMALEMVISSSSEGRSRSPSPSPSLPLEEGLLQKEITKSTNSLTLHAGALEVETASLKLEDGTGEWLRSRP